LARNQKPKIVSPLSFIANASTWTNYSIARGAFLGRFYPGNQGVPSAKPFMRHFCKKPSMKRAMKRHGNGAPAILSIDILDSLIDGAMRPLREEHRVRV
jgi:hypothetical protein